MLFTFRVCVMSYSQQRAHTHNILTSLESFSSRLRFMLQQFDSARSKYTDSSASARSAIERRRVIVVARARVCVYSGNCADCSHSRQPARFIAAVKRARDYNIAVDTPRSNGTKCHTIETNIDDKINKSLTSHGAVIFGIRVRVCVCDFSDSSATSGRMCTSSCACVRIFCPLILSAREK